MTRRLILQPDAVTDLERHYDYIAQDSPPSADRFIQAARQTFEGLLVHPEMGRITEFRRSRLKSIRQWRVKGFDKHLVFYQVSNEAVIILRVFHGMRNLEVLLNEFE